MAWFGLIERILKDSSILISIQFPMNNRNVCQLTPTKVETLNSLVPICTWLWLKASRTSLTINRNLMKETNTNTMQLWEFLCLLVRNILESFTLFLIGYPCYSTVVRWPRRWDYYNYQYFQWFLLGATVQRRQKGSREWLEEMEGSRGHHSADCRRLLTIQWAEFLRHQSLFHQAFPVLLQSIFAIHSAGLWFVPVVQHS